MVADFTPNDSSGGSGGSVPKEMADPGAMFTKGGNLSKETLDKYRSSAKAMRAAAEGGGFGISEDAGNAYIKAWTNFQDKLPKIRRDIDIAATPVNLGGDEFAKTVAQHTARSARGGEDSFEHALDALQILAEEAIAAFTAAKKNYAALDEAGAQSFTSKELFGE